MRGCTYTEDHSFVVSVLLQHWLLVRLKHSTAQAGV
jgi:hypothetical protein